MKTIDIADASDPLATYASGAKREPLVITRKGKPVMALVSVAGVDLETLALSENQQFLAIIEKSRASIRGKGTISAGEMRRRLGIRPKWRARA